MNYTNFTINALVAANSNGQHQQIPFRLGEQVGCAQSNNNLIKLNNTNAQQARQAQTNSSFAPSAIAPVQLIGNHLGTNNLVFNASNLIKQTNGNQTISNWPPLSIPHQASYPVNLVENSKQQQGFDLKFNCMNRVDPPKPLSNPNANNLNSPGNVNAGDDVNVDNDDLQNDRAKSRNNDDDDDDDDDDEDDDDDREENRRRARKTKIPKTVSIYRLALCNQKPINGLSY